MKYNTPSQESSLYFKSLDAFKFSPPALFKLLSNTINIDKTKKIFFILDNDIIFWPAGNSMSSGALQPEIQLINETTYPATSILLSGYCIQFDKPLEISNSFSFFSSSSSIADYSRYYDVVNNLVAEYSNNNTVNSGQLVITAHHDIAIPDIQTYISFIRYFPNLSSSSSSSSSSSPSTENETKPKYSAIQRSGLKTVNIVC